LTWTADAALWMVDAHGTDFVPGEQEFYYLDIPIR
jgi:hypothetical protein